ncbi:MAG: MFS transporter [Spirochaetae bacterium HGW-Spirochaetae-7]|jgi:DHA1 family tetracycline resistance protein-like MFS transporter|nr:MAG: MFS transporter [Spirochaetae bacterium HGW-Spirochaetae-7]
MQKRKASLPLLFSVVFMDMVGFGFIIPLIPDYIRNFGGAPALAGILMASYALGQFFAAPIVGRLSDRFGRKPLFLFSIGGTFLSLLLLGFARSLPLIFASRILDGLTGGNITVAQSYIVDITDDKNRAKGFGIIGMAFGFGFIIGPLFGGLLSRFGLSTPAFVAAGIAAVNLLLITFILPESLSSERRDELKKNPRRAFSGTLLLETLKRRGTGTVLRMTMVYSFAFTMFESMFALFTAEALGVGPSGRGWLLAYVGVLVALVQGGGVGFLARRFDERKLAAGAISVAAVSLALYSLAPSVPALMVTLLPLSLGSGVANTMLRTLLTKSVPREAAGGTLGIAASIDSINRILAPLVGGLVLGWIGPRAPGILAATLAGLVAWYGWKRLVTEDCLSPDAVPGACAEVL